MPKKSKKSKKKSKPNVYVQNTASTNTIEENIKEPSAIQPSQKLTKKVTADTLPSNYFSGEIKKMGVIATSMVIILAILTIVLG
tara:strand:+ start:77 stop:328 length:252 start_codon:yes stop_codon:yes gene_type:complete